MASFEAGKGFTRFRDRLFNSSGRGGAVLRTAGVSMFARGFSIVSSLVTVPIILHHLGSERYGIWMAALALAAWFTMADGGINKGLIAQVSQAYGKNDRAGMRALISSAMALTVAMCLIVLVVVLIGVRLVDWRWAFHLNDAATGREAGTVIAIICGFYALSFPATVVREARLGMLQGATVNIWDFGGSVLGFAGLLAAVNLGYGLVAIAAVWAGAPVLARTLGTLVFLAREGRDLIPSWRDVQGSACRGLLNAGGAFMIYTFVVMIAVQSDQLLIANILGAEQVTAYSIVQRLFNQPQILVTLFLAAQWPAYGEALGRGDLAWIRRHFRQTLLGFTIFSVVLCGLLGLFCQDILRLWVGAAVVASPLLVVSMAVYGVIAVITTVFSFFYMSVELYRPLIITQVTMALINLPLSIFLLPRIGSAGAIIGTTVGYLLAVIIPSFYILRDLMMDLPQNKLSAVLKSNLVVQILPTSQGPLA